MKNAKKLISVILGASIALGALTACGSSKTAANGSGKVDAATEQTNGDYKVLSIGAGGTDGSRRGNRCDPSTEAGSGRPHRA